MADTVNHPNHYGGQDNPYETIKVIEAWQLGFNLGNVVKYITRAGKKDSDPAEDLKKAKWYLEREIKKHTKKLDKLVVCSLSENDVLFLIKEAINIAYGSTRSSIVDNLKIKDIACGVNYEIMVGPLFSIFITRTPDFYFTLEIIVSYTALSNDKTGEKVLGKLYDFCDKNGFKCEL